MFRISLRQLLILVAAIAFAIVSLKYASLTWVAIIAALAIGYVFMAAIVAAVDRGKRQAFAIGAVIVIVGYGILIKNGTRAYDPNAVPRNLEFEKYGQLPTTQLLAHLYEAVVIRTYRDGATGQILHNYDPYSNPARSVSLITASPRQDSFMQIGHIWWALLFGFIGGHFARFVYVRRTKEQATQPKD